MTDEERTRLALWRYGLIAPVITGTHSFPSNRAYFRHLAGREHVNPVTGEPRKFCSGTFEVWASAYRRYGYDGLVSDPRKDRGISRRLKEEAQQEIIELRRKYPRIINTAIRQQLIREGLINASVSQSTIDRFVRLLKKEPELEQIHQGKERKAFEFEYANQCWQADTTHLRKVDGKKTYLISILDDASRMAVGYEIFYADNAVNFQKVLKNAILTYGVPAILYVDNGSPYDIQQLELICARVGIQLVHAPVRDGSAKGKQERLFRSIKEHFVYSRDWSEHKTLEQLNASFDAYMSGEYTNAPHSSLKNGDGGPMTPRERFLRDAEHLRFIPEGELERSFLHEYKRKVRSDSTIIVDKTSYEVPYEYMREEVRAFIDPGQKENAWILPGNESTWIPVHPVNKLENRNIRRKQYMKFEKGDG